MLIYDLLAINMQSVVDLPFQDRYQAIVDHVLWPRRLEKELLTNEGREYTLPNGERRICPLNWKVLRASFLFHP